MEVTALKNNYVDFSLVKYSIRGLIIFFKVY